MGVYTTLRLQDAFDSSVCQRLSLSLICFIFLELTQLFFQEPKGFGSADGWPASCRLAGGGALAEDQCTGPRMGRNSECAKRRKSRSACMGMVVGLGAAVNGSSEWAHGRRATGGSRQISTHQRAYARDESEKLGDASAWSGVRGCHCANGTLSGQTTRGRRRTSGLTLLLPRIRAAP